MPKYLRSYVPGGSYFLTLVTYNRNPIFRKQENISRLRTALRTVKSEMPFEIAGAVMLPDHIHFIWSLPTEDSDYSIRIGRLKALFTKSLSLELTLERNTSSSRRKHRESNVWQRRFWEHTLRDEEDFQIHLDYIHYNPVKHGYVQCPHLWPPSSFHHWVKNGGYSADWCCTCNDRHSKIPDFASIESHVGE